MKSINAILKLKPILAMACLIAGPLGVRAEAQTYTVPAAATSSQITAYTGLTQAQALAVDNAGNIFYANPTLGQLMEQPVSGGTPIVVYTETGGGGSYPKGIAVDTLGNAYITDYSGHLWKVPTGGGTAVDILTACNSLDAYYLGTFDVSTDGSGNVYTIGQESDVFEITPAGTCSVVATSAGGAYACRERSCRERLLLAWHNSLFVTRGGEDTGRCECYIRCNQRSAGRCIRQPVRDGYQHDR